MKRLIFIAVLVALFVGIVSVSAYAVVQKQSWDFSAIIEDNGKNVKIYTVEQEKAICYVVLGPTAQVNPQSVAISCLPKVK